MDIKQIYENINIKKQAEYQIKVKALYVFQGGHDW